MIEANLWFGDLAPEGPGRSSLVINREGLATVLSTPGDPSGPVELADVGNLRTYLYEPDGAVLRAGLVNRVADQLGGHLLDPTIAYVTSDRLAATPLATAFRVIDSMPFSLKRLKSALRERNIGTLEIKKRGSALDPAKLRPQLALKGSQSATIVLTRLAGQQQVLLVERVNPAPHPEES